MTGLSHYEFAESLCDEFGLLFICDRLIAFDSLHEKVHVKVLINDLMDLPCFSTVKISEFDQQPIINNSSFENVIAWRNKDGFYINWFWQKNYLVLCFISLLEVKKLKCDV